MKASIRMATGVLIVLILSYLDLAGQSTRLFRPGDMFQMRRVGATVWSGDGRYAAIEFSKPSRWLDGVPTNDLSLLDVRTRSLRQLSPRSTAYLGFFNAHGRPTVNAWPFFLSIEMRLCVFGCGRWERLLLHCCRTWKREPINR
jgi:hypothetical protein